MKSKLKSNTWKSLVRVNKTQTSDGHQGSEIMYTNDKKNE